MNNNNMKENNSRKSGEIKIERSEKTQREMCAITSRGKGEISLGHGVLYNQCFRGTDYQSQYEEECPVNYSLKYSETDPCKGGKPERTNGKFKEYAEYAETDLDQPTDFSLKYGESEEGDKKMWSSHQKGSDFNFYERHKPKESSSFHSRREVEEMPGGPEREHYSCEDVTPLMFSRCSSLNSLSSFELITHSIPDDRSSVVSEFSMTTSGIISPSELPDSPTQTAPSSPKRLKSVCFPPREDIRQKKSVFEDDVATYKQEDTPIEFSRATSLSSLNIDNPVKVDSNLKTNSKASSVAGGDDSKVKDVSIYTTVDSFKSGDKENSFIGKPKVEDLRSEDCGSVSEADDILIDGINNIRIDENRMTPGLNGRESDSANIIVNVDVKESRHIRSPSPQSSQRLSSNGEFKVQTTIPPIFPNTTYEASDDDVHTYHTEGTPANISHAGSHSDLSTLSLISGVPPSGTANNSDDDSFCSEGEEVLNESCERLNLPEKNVTGSFSLLNEGPVEDLYSKSCSPLDEALVEQCIRMGMPQKSNPIKLNEREPDNWFSKSCTPFEEALVEQCIRLGMPRKSKKEEPFNVITSSERPVDTWLSKSCTPLEEALVEQCIRLGMPKKNRKTEPINSGALKDVLDQRYFFPLKAATNPRRQFGDIKASQINPRNYQYPPKPVSMTPPPFPSYPVDLSRRTRSVSSLPASDSHWYNQEPESCTPFEEALVEQCIRLGMPQRNIQRKVASEKDENNANKGTESVEESPALGKTNAKGVQANRSRMSRSSDKEKDGLKKSERFVCTPAKRQVGRRKKSKETCRRCRKCREKSKGLV